MDEWPGLTYTELPHETCVQQKLEWCRTIEGKENRKESQGELLAWIKWHSLRLKGNP